MLLSLYYGECWHWQHQFQARGTSSSNTTLLIKVDQDSGCSPKPSKSKKPKRREVGQFESMVKGKPAYMLFVIYHSLDNYINYIYIYVDIYIYIHEKCSDPCNRQNLKDVSSQAAFAFKGVGINSQYNTRTVEISKP